MDESVKMDEIHKLLSKIDKDSARILTLESNLEESHKETARLQTLVDKLKTKSQSRHRQQSQMIKERDRAVRDISCELSHVSTTLKRREETGGEQSRKLEKLRNEVFKCEGRLEQANATIGKRDEQMVKLKKEIEEMGKTKAELESLVQMYDELKLQLKFEEERRVRERQKVYEKAQNLFKSVSEVKQDLSKSEAFLKATLSPGSNSPRTKSSFNNGSLPNSRSERSESGSDRLRNAKVGLLNAQNAFLKRKVFLLLNEYFVQYVEPVEKLEVPKRTSVFVQNLSECSISQSKVSVTPGTEDSEGVGMGVEKRLKAGGAKRLPVPSLKFEQSVYSDSVEVEVSVSSENWNLKDGNSTSFVEGSHVIGGVTYHMLRHTRGNKFAAFSQDGRCFWTHYHILKLVIRKNKVK